jgi:uncharacterized membrane protein
LPTYPVVVHNPAEAVAAMVSGILVMLSGSGSFLLWNLLLALAPAGLALVLFRPGVRRGIAWWFAVVVFVLLLPNAPYVLTDVGHLVQQVHGADSRFEILAVILPVFAVFFVIGFGSYVAALRRLRSYVLAETTAARWAIVALALHALCAIGVFVGRFFRFNSWTVVEDPGAIVHSLRFFLDRGVLILLAVIFLVIAGLTVTSNAVLDAGIHRARVWTRRHG